MTAPPGARQSLPVRLVKHFAQPIGGALPDGGRMIDVFALAERLSMTARKLPLGFKQRLALACAVVHEPEALFWTSPPPASTRSPAANFRLSC